MDDMIDSAHDEEEIASCDFNEGKKMWEQMHLLEETRYRDSKRAEQTKEKGRYRKFSGFDSSEAGAILTPDTSTISEPFPETANNDGAPVQRDAIPRPGNTYITMDKKHGRPVTLVDGKLQLQPDSCSPGNCHWVYVESTNWIGFRDEASGTFLGHDNRTKIRASVPHQKGWECWSIRPCPDGGYFLIHTYGDGLL